MKNNRHSWFYIMASTLDVFYTYTKRINAIALSYEVSPEQRMVDIQNLLAHFYEDLSTCYKNQLDLVFDFPIPKNKYKEDYYSMGIRCSVYFN